MKTFGTQSCETELAKGPGTSYRIIKLHQGGDFFLFKKDKKWRGGGWKLVFSCPLFVSPVLPCFGFFIM